jgi:hypothetical protein
VGGGTPVYVYFMIVALIAAIISLYQKRTFPRIGAIVGFIIASLAVELIGSEMANHGFRNTWVYNTYNFFEFSLLCYYFYHLLSFRSMKILVVTAYIIYVPFYFINFFYLQGLHNVNTYTLLYCAFLDIVFVIGYFWILFRLPQSTRLMREPAFWICTGVLFYYTCSLPYSGLINYISAYSSRKMIEIYSFINSMGIIFFYILLTIAFLCRIKPQKSMP